MSHTKEQIMEQAQVFASGWSLVGGIFDHGYAMEDAEQSKAELAEMVGDVVNQRDELLAELSNAATYHRSHECYSEASRLDKYIATVKGSAS